MMWVRRALISRQHEPLLSRSVIRLLFTRTATSTACRSCSSSGSSKRQFSNSDTIFSLRDTENPSATPTSPSDIAKSQETSAISLSKRSELAYILEPLQDSAIELAGRLLRNQQLLSTGSRHSTPELIVSFDMHGAGKTNFGRRFQQDYLTNYTVQQTLQSKYFGKPKQLQLLSNLTRSRNLSVNLLQLMPDPFLGANIQHALAYCVWVAATFGSSGMLPHRSQFPPFNDAFLASPESDLIGLVKKLIEKEAGLFLFFDDIEWLEQEIYQPLWQTPDLRRTRYEEDDPFEFNVVLYTELWTCMVPLLKTPNCFVYCAGLTDAMTCLLLNKNLLVLPDASEFEPAPLKLGKMDAKAVKLAAKRTQTPLLLHAAKDEGTGLLQASGERVEGEPRIEIFSVGGEVEGQAEGEVFKSSTLEDVLQLNEKGYHFIVERTAGLPSFVRELMWALCKVRLTSPGKREEDWHNENTLLSAVELAEKEMFKVGWEIDKAGAGKG
eukprot:gb/GEZN01007168.1/.p1 GENE.gb/GEZN01007168.1/~~gb/GEZN01007168.1/.p1  ORF type:complete len:495 (-),score=61.78 gb/GEZN01007168.1/:68-1552(-)